MHRVQDCPNTSKSEKKRLIEEYKKNRNENNDRNQTAKRQHRLGRLLHCEGLNYNINVMIGGVETVARDETGADITVVQM